MQEMLSAIRNGDSTVTIGDKDMGLLEAAKHTAVTCLGAMEGRRLQLALMVCAAVADYAALDE